MINDHTLNIFTDASISKDQNGITIGSSGAEFYIGYNLVDSDIRIMFETTNNESEITSILLGVMGALRLRTHFKIDTINLFSDSRISVYALREWIFSWLKGITDGVIYSSSGNPVANQRIILEIIDLIIRNSLYINLFHVRGHKDSGKMKDYITFKSSFIKENNIKKSTAIDDVLIQFLIDGNSSIDNYTRSKLYNKLYMDLARQNGLGLINPFTINQEIYLNTLNTNKYKICLGLGG